MSSVKESDGGVRGSVLALCSSCAEFTREVGDALEIVYVVFSEYIHDFKRERGIRIGFDGSKRLPVNAGIVSSLVLPALEKFREDIAGGRVKADIVLFDMDSLIHDEVACEVAKCFRLLGLKKETMIGATLIEDTLCEEYRSQIDRICESVIDFDALGFDGAVKVLKGYLEEI